LENCHRKLKQTNKNVSFEKNSKGLILKIGSRRSNNYSRIYEANNSLKFEHEMKRKVLHQYQLLLVENRLEEFEQKLH
jgi:DNA relaxase NicK